MTVRVLVADDEHLVRTGLAMILSTEDDLEVVALAENGEVAVRLTRELAPDVVLMDVRMPVLDGIEATRLIVAGPGDPPAVLALTTYHVDDAVIGALRAGASGFVLKDTAPEQLVGAVRAVAAGEAWLGPAVAKRLLADFRTRLEPATPSSDDIAELTPREREVLALVAHGLSNQEIAQFLTVAETTAKTHVSRILIKLGLRDRAQAVGAAYRRHLIDPDDPPPRPPESRSTASNDPRGGRRPGR